MSYLDLQDDDGGYRDDEADDLIDDHDGEDQRVWWLREEFEDLRS